MKKSHSSLPYPHSASTGVQDRSTSWSGEILSGSRLEWILYYYFMNVLVWTRSGIIECNLNAGFILSCGRSQEVFL